MKFKNISQEDIYKAKLIDVTFDPFYNLLDIPYSWRITVNCEQWSEIYFLLNTSFDIRKIGNYLDTVLFLPLIMATK
jgi:hypothetical protein